MPNKTELLAPAGQWESLVAAVQAGADAVYLGGKVLNARRGAGNFDGEELKRAADYLHERGKKLYVTVNTVVKQEELGELEQLAGELAACRADAAIVQDFGVSEVLRAMVPGLHLHASTQMAVNNVQGARFLKERGFERVVLAREMSLEEIRLCAASGIETEVFCHGALCVACSGQCLFSSLVGGRSGNRGACAQPCRLPYRLSGAMNAEGYLLSPKDLMTAGFLSELTDAGVSSLKIEGRLKRSEYVAVVTGIYRKLLDGGRLTAEDEEELKQIFNRGGFTEGYAKGIKDGEFLSTRRPSHWGVRVGTADRGRIILEKNLKTDDALVLRSDDREETPLKAEGTAGSKITNRTGRSGIVYRMVSDVQLRRAQEVINGERSFAVLSAEAEFRVGKPACLTLTDGVHTVSCTGEAVQAARSAGTDEERIRAQLIKTGGTPYTIGETRINADADAFVPASMVNGLRRDCIARLGEMRIEANAGAEGRVNAYTAAEPTKSREASAKLVAQGESTVLLRNCLDAGAEEAVFAPRDVRVKALEETDVRGMFLYVPPVLGSKTLDDLNAWTNRPETGLKGVYITNIGQMNLSWPGEIRFDYTLNIANRPALSFLKAGDALYTPSCELTAREITQIGGRYELPVYGYLPLMHLRHCPLNAARGGEAHTQCRACDSAAPGKRLTDCRFTDRKNVSFGFERTATDEGCVIDLMNSVPLCLASHMDRLPAPEAYRLIFTKESAGEAAKITSAFLSIMRGGTVKDGLPNEITTGHYFRKTE